MNSSISRLALVFASLALGSCLGGGGDGGNAPPTGACEFITGGNSQVTSDTADGCFGCSASEKENAADGDLASFAQVTAPTSFAGQGVAIRATTQPGILFAAGQRAGVYFRGPESSGFGSPAQAVTITTYLGGEIQETPTSFDTETDENGVIYKSFVTSDIFDAVEVMVSNTQAATGPFEIYEICSNGGD